MTRYSADDDGLVDGDDAQDILDILPSDFLSCGHVAMGDPDYEVRLDINQDGKIDFYYDYAPVYNSNGLESPPSGWISDPRMPLQDGVTGPDNPIGYTGHVFDPETGFYLARNRHYMPEFGRWAQRDPAGYIDGANTYQYAFSAPIIYSDPFGLCADQPYRHNSQDILDAMVNRGCISQDQADQASGMVGTSGDDQGGGYPGASGEAIAGLAGGIAFDGAIASTAWGRVQIPSQLILYNTASNPRDISDFIRDVVRRGEAARKIKLAGKIGGPLLGAGFTAWEMHSQYTDGADSLEIAGTGFGGASGIAVGAAIGMGVGGPPGAALGIGVGVATTFITPVASELVYRHLLGGMTEKEMISEEMRETCEWLAKKYIESLGGGSSSSGPAK